MAIGDEDLENDVWRKKSLKVRSWELRLGVRVEPMP